MEHAPSGTDVLVQLANGNSPQAIFIKSAKKVGATVAAEYATEAINQLVDAGFGSVLNTLQTCTEWFDNWEFQFGYGTVPYWRPKFKQPGVVVKTASGISNDMAYKRYRKKGHKSTYKRKRRRTGARGSLATKAYVKKALSRNIETKFHEHAISSNDWGRQFLGGLFYPTAFVDHDTETYVLNAKNSAIISGFIYHPARATDFAGENHIDAVQQNIADSPSAYNTFDIYKWADNTYTNLPATGGVDITLLDGPPMAPLLGGLTQDDDGDGIVGNEITPTSMICQLAVGTLGSHDYNESWTGEVGLRVIIVQSKQWRKLPPTVNELLDLRWWRTQGTPPLDKTKSLNQVSYVNSGEEAQVDAIGYAAAAMMARFLPDARKKFRIVHDKIYKFWNNASAGGQEKILEIVKDLNPSKIQYKRSTSDQNLSFWDDSQETTGGYYIFALSDMDHMAVTEQWTGKTGNDPVGVIDDGYALPDCSYFGTTFRIATVSRLYYRDA